MAADGNGSVRSYRDVVVWKQAMDLAAICYVKTKEFPRSEIYGMTARIRRSSASVPANIAEGNGRENTGSYIQFLRMAQGSLKELETHVLLARQVELLERQRGSVGSKRASWQTPASAHKVLAAKGSTTVS